MDNLERVNNVYFELYSKELSRVTIEEPKGWNEDFLSLERDKDSKDIRKKIEIDLSFFGKGSNYLQNLYYGHGISPVCFVIKYEKSDTGVEENWNLVYIQRIDLTSFKVDRDTGEVTVKAKEGGLFDLIKNRYDDEFDIIDPYSIDGDYIGELKTELFQAVEREIFLKSLLEGDWENYRIGTGYWESEVIWSGRPVPFKITYESDAAGDIQVPTLVQDYYNDGRDRHAPADPTIDFTVGSDLPFFFEAEEYKVIKVKANITFKITEFEERWVENEANFQVRFVKSYRGEDGLQKLKEYTNVIDLPLQANVGVSHTVTFDETIELEEGESMSMIYVTRVGIDSTLNPFQNGFANTFVNSDASIALTDITPYPPKIGRCVKPIDFFDRLVAKITGQTGLVRSSVFETGGEFEFRVLDNGFFARGFPDTYEDEDGEEISIQFKTSFKEAFESFDAVEPMCWVSQKEGSKEVIRIEPDTYTMQNFIGATIEVADDIAEECSNKDQFSKISLGHEADMEYEEVNGLDEPNGKSEFSTHLGAGVNATYSKTSKYRFDSLGYELTRRVGFDRFPYEDTERDDDIWIHDGKKVGGVITHRTWEDDFDEPPKGVVFPDSIWNLRFSPMNLLYRGHGRAVRRCLYHNTNRFIRFSSSNANQNLITLAGGLELKESGQLQLSKMEKQLVKADTVSMTVKVTQELRNQLEGVNRHGVRNVFGLIAYFDKGTKKYGRITKLTSGENSKLELIKAGI